MNVTGRTEKEASFLWGSTSSGHLLVIMHAVVKPRASGTEVVTPPAQRCFKVWVEEGRSSRENRRGQVRNTQTFATEN